MHNLSSIGALRWKLTPVVALLAVMTAQAAWAQQAENSNTMPEVSLPGGAAPVAPVQAAPVPATSAAPAVAEAATPVQAAPVPATSAAPAAAEAAAPAAPAVADGAVSEAADATKPGGKPIPKSIFFSDGDMADIRRALANFDISRRGGPIDVDYLTRISEIGKKKGSPSATREKRMYIYPQFYLSSIIYNSSTDWIVWLDNHKITPESMKAADEAKERGDPTQVSSGVRKLDVRAINVNPKDATFEWSPASMERALLTWDPFADNGVRVDMTRGVISFTLRPNQTFSSYRMMAMEGKLIPLQIAEEDMQLPSTLLEGEEYEEEVSSEEETEEDTSVITETPAAAP